MKEISNRKKEIFFLTLAVSLSALVIFGAVLYFAMKRLIKPIKELSVGAEIVGKGDLTHRVEIKSKDEVGELAEAFNKMASDLKRSRDELTAVKEYTDNIINSMMNSLIVVSPEGEIQYVNPVTCSLLGYEENEIVGQHIGTIFAEEEEEEEEEEELPFKGSGLAALIKRGTARNLEKTYLSKDGRKIPVLFSMSVMRDKEGKIQGIVCVAQDITERKHAEQQLRLYGEIIANMAEGVYLIRASDGVIVYANRKFEEMFGYDAGELIGKHVSIVNAITEKSREDIAREIMETLNKKGIWRGEVHNIKKDGIPFWCYANVSTFEHPDYGPVWIAVHQDITQRKWAEEALRESEERYRNLFNNIPIGVYRTTPKGQILDVNPALVQIFGYPDRETFLMIPVSDTYVNSEDRSQWQARMERDGIVRNFETQFRRVDGRIIWLESNSRATRDADGRILYYEGSFEDITERKRAEEELRKSEERFKQVTENAEEWIWEVDANGLYTYSSPVVERILGYKPEEVVGKKYFYDFFSLDVREDLKNAAFEGFVRKAAFRNFINPNLHKNGNLVYLETNGAPVLDENGNLLGYRGADTDITEHKRAEEAREKLIRELEKALSQVKQLKGLLPICTYCKKIRKDKDYWQAVDSYITEHSEAVFSHGVCPECKKKYLDSQFEEPERRGKS